MVKKVLAVLIILVIFLPSIPVSTKASPCAEIIDTKQNRVVKSFQVNSEIYNMVATSVKNIDDLCGKLAPVKVDGYAVKIPLDPAVKVKKKSLNAVVSEVYIVVPQKGRPFFMIFEDKNKPSYFKFHGDIDSLSKALDFNLRN